MPKSVVSSAISAQGDCLRYISEREASEHDRVSKLNFKPFRTLAPDQLYRLGTRPQQCHNNCWSAELSCPDGDAKRVIGWKRLFNDEDGYLLHSVMLIEGELIDITPSIAFTGRECFAADPALTLLFDARREYILAPDGKEALPEIRSRAHRDAIFAYKRRVNRGMGKVAAAMVNDDGKGGLLRFLIDVPTALS